MKIKLSELRKMIEEEQQKALVEMNQEDRVSELQELAQGRHGKQIILAGNKVISAANVISEVGANQTGEIRRVLHEIALFAGKLGGALGAIGGSNMGEGEMLVSEQLPTPQEAKRLQKIVSKLER